MTTISFDRKWRCGCQTMPVHIDLKSGNTHSKQFLSSAEVNVEYKPSNWIDGWIIYNVRVKSMGSTEGALRSWCRHFSRPLYVWYILDNNKVIGKFFYHDRKHVPDCSTWVGSYCPPYIVKLTPARLKSQRRLPVTQAVWLNFHNNTMWHILYQYYKKIAILKFPGYSLNNISQLNLWCVTCEW